MSQRIIVVLNWLELGGAERQALLYAQHLASTGHRVEIWGLEAGEGRVTTTCAELGIAWRAGMRRRGRGFFGLAREIGWFAQGLRAANASIVLPYGLVPNLLCGAAGRWGGARVVVWNQRDEGRDFTGRRLERYALQRATLRIANSQHGAQFLEQRFALPAGSVSVVHNGVTVAPPRASREAWRERLGVAADLPLVTMCANLHRYKDHRTLIEAWRDVVANHGSSGRAVPQLLLAGRFDDTHAAVQAQVEATGLGAHVRLLGPVADIGGLLGAVDLAVFSSRLEGCPNAVLEAMASGLAVVGTDIPGIREAVGAAGAPWLAPPGDAPDLARKLVTLLGEPQLRAELGRRNQQRALEQFCSTKMAAQLDRLLGL